MRTHTALSAALPLLALLTSCFAQGDYRGSDSGPNRKLTFPSRFFFGAGSSSYQTEGAWNVSGKSESIWDVFTHKPGTIKDNSTGDDACKSYEYYKRDTQMLNYLGVDFYRISMSWPRILPTGFPDKINQEAIDHYSDVIEDLLANGIRPLVTMYHWDLPQNIQELGGWANPQIAYWFQDYARVLFDNFGPRVKIWATINEPAQIVRGYNSKELAPGLESFAGIADYLAAKNIIMAHARVFHMFDQEYRQKTKAIVGISLSTDYYEGLTNSTEDAQAAKDAYNAEVGIYAHPIFSLEGGFPPRLVELVAAKSKEQGFFRSRLPEFTDEERKFCQGAADFYGLNHYSTQYVTRNGYKPDEKAIPSMKDDLGVVKSFKNYPLTESDHVAVIPHGISGALRYIKESFEDSTNPAIIVTENGAAQAALEDTEKIDYLKKYLTNILGAMIEDSVNVIAYSVWSLMDNFEWSDGYTVKFGLFKVDFNDPTRKREARLSAVWYRNVVQTMTLDPDYVPTYEKAEF